MEKKNYSTGLLPSLINQLDFCLVDVSYIIKRKKEIRLWVIRAAEKEKKSIASISFNLCSDEYLLKLNNDHLNHDYYTDIITFDFSKKGVLSADIYISIDRVKENAKTENKTITNELCRILIHGMLHLCGYKDKRPQDARKMREKEDYYLSLLNV